MTSWWDDITGYVQFVQDRNLAQKRILESQNVDELQKVVASLPTAIVQDKSINDIYKFKLDDLTGKNDKYYNPLAGIISGSLSKWLEYIKQFENAKPEDAQKNLVNISSKVTEIALATASIDVAAGLLPNGEGVVSSTNTKQMLAWLGFGAILAAVAHDPVKIGILRPYQDSLEATFRNKRPDHIEVLKAYQQRSLSPTRIDDVNAITDDLMNQVEKENDQKLDDELARHGYKQDFINVMKDAETKALTFSNLAQLAKMGHYSRPLATFSLWGYGLDRRLMKAALDTLDRMNTSSQYEGFRALIEPAYTDGSIEESDLVWYWNHIRVPQDVQDKVLPRMRKIREKALAKAPGTATTKEKDLTISQISTAYVDGLMTREKAKDDIIRLGYDVEETEILLSIADTRKKTPSASKLKRLPLSDYEKAYKYKLISADAVIQRMTGEYDPRDIELERQLMKAGKE